MHRILHIISDTNIGGAGKLLLVYLANHDRKNFDVTVVLPKGSLLLPEIQKLNVRTIEVDGIADKSFALGAVKMLIDLYKKENPHIIHSHASLSARIAAKMAKKFVVHTRHSVYNRQGAGPQHAYKKKFPYKNVAGFINNKLSDKIIATSPAAKISLVEMGTNQRKTVMIYNAIDGLRQLSREEKSAQRHKWGIKDDDFVCSMIARLEKVKGHEYVLKAAQMVQSEGIPVKFLLVGVGSEEANLKKMVKDLELDNVIFTGFVKDVEEILGISHIQINASFSETTNLALLEGLSLGVPAIVTDVGGNPFVVNDGVNGVLFESKDYAALYKAIVNLRNSPAEYAHFSKRSKEIFNERFTAPVMTKKVEDVYCNLLGVGVVDGEEDIKETK